MASGLVPCTGNLDLRYLARGCADGPWTAGTESDADQILDAFSTTDFSNHIMWCIISSTGATGQQYTDKVYIRSTCGTIFTGDDIVMRLTTSDGMWTVITYKQSLLDNPASRLVIRRTS